MGEKAALGSRLAQALVAFTIEVDNEFERRMIELGRPGMRTSLVMWAGVMRYVLPEGLELPELSRRSGLTPDAVRFAVGGLQRWGYLHQTGDGALAPTSAGREALHVWRDLLPRVEAQWRDRLGDQLIDTIEGRLGTITSTLGPEVPDYLPAFGLPGTDREELVDDCQLFARLSRAVVAFTLHHDGACPSPRGLTANVLRVLTTDADRSVRDLPAACGIAKETIHASLAQADAEGLVRLATTDSGRGRTARLTEAGAERARRSIGIDHDIAQGWRSSHREAVNDLADALAELMCRRDERGSVLGRGLEPDAAGWRANPPYKSQTKRLLNDPGGALPHHPMPVRQGGWPDGA